MDDLSKWRDAFDADSEGRPERLAALVRDDDVPASVRELLAQRIARTSKIGRPKAKRNADGATESREDQVRAYEAYWDALKFGQSPDEAEAIARKHCPRTTETELSKLLLNGVTPVNEITKSRGTFQPNPKRFLKLLKTTDAQKCT